MTDSAKPAAGELKEPSGEESDQLWRDTVARATHNATTALAGVEALKDLLAMHVDYCNKSNAEARESRSILHAKVETAQGATVAAIAKLGVELGGEVEGLRKRLDGHRGWVVGLILTIAGTVIVAQMAAIGWLVAELWQDGRAGL